MLAAAILCIHLAIIAFNLFGLVIVPIGAWRGWDFVRIAWWRLLHIASLAVTAVQAVLGRTCFLTDWQFEAAEGQGHADPMIMSWINSLIYYEVPVWVFAIIYIAVFAYALSLLWLVPVRWRSFS